MSRYVKLGLFFIVGMLALVAALTTVGYRTLTEDHQTYAVYFAESVQGLSLGSAVKFRGVVVGNVSDVRIAPDGRHVRVECELFIDSVQRIDLGGGRDSEAQLCAQLSSVGLTGTKIVSLDVFAPEECTPVDTLPFEVSHNAIPATPSTLRDVEHAVQRLAKAAPEIANNLSQLVERVNRLVGDVDAQGADAATLASTMARLNDTLGTIDQVLQGLNTKKTSRELRLTLREVRKTSVTVDELLARLDERRGLVTRMERASSAVGDLALGLDYDSGSIDTTLRDISEAARAVKRLADALERDPDMLLKGRAELGP